MDSPVNDNPVQANPWLLVYTFGLVFFQGLLVNHSTVLLPVLKDVYSLDEAALGRMASLAFASALPALLISGYVTEWLRPKRSGILAVVLMGTGCLAMGMSRSFAMVIGGLMVLQFGINWVLAVQSSIIAGFFPQLRQRLFFLAMAMLAMGAIFGPPAIGWAIERVTANDSLAAWGTVYVWLGGLVWGLLALLLLVCGGRLAPIAGQPGGAQQSFRVRRGQSLGKRLKKLFVSGVFNRPAFYLLGLIVLFDNLAAINILTWVGVMAQERFDATPVKIGYLSSLMAMGVVLGRIFMATFVSGRISDRKLLGYSYGIAMLIFMFMLITPSMNMLYVLYFLMSVFISAQSATTYAIGADKFGERAAIGIPLVDGVGSLGSLAAPLIMGMFAVWFSLDYALWMIPVFGFMLVMITLGWEWFDSGGTGKRVREAEA